MFGKGLKISTELKATSSERLATQGELDSVKDLKNCDDKELSTTGWFNCPQYNFMKLCNFLWRNIKYLSLLILVVQNTALVLTMRYSRIKHGEKVYLASTVVFLTEILKFIICMLVISCNSRFDMDKVVNILDTEIFRKPKDTARLCIPSILYTIQNNLLFVALSNLDAATFQVTYQLKILSTALFSVFILNKDLSRQKWFALLVLAIAVVLVQWSMKSATIRDSRTSTSPFLGLLAVVLACISSGFTGVYIEKILKQSGTSMWIRNIQLSLLSFFTSLFGVFVTDWKLVSTGGFFQGYNYIVLVVILLQALGGITIAVVMKYADNILKGFATSLSIVLSSTISFFFLNDFKPSWFFIIGTFLVLSATFIYSQPTPLPLPTTTDDLKSPQSRNV